MLLTVSGSGIHLEHQQRTAMTTREYFQARYEKAERDMRNAITEEERIAAYERRETAKRQLEMSND